MKEGNHACDPFSFSLHYALSRQHTFRQPPNTVQSNHSVGTEMASAVACHSDRRTPRQKTKKLKTQQSTTINHPHVCARVQNAVFLLRAAYVSRYSPFMHQGATTLPILPAKRPATLRVFFPTRRLSCLAGGSWFKSLRPVTGGQGADRVILSAITLLSRSGGFCGTSAGQYAPAKSVTRGAGLLYDLTCVLSVAVRSR